MIDPALHARQARAARAYVIHVELTGEPPPATPTPDSDELLCECGCGRQLTPNYRGGLHKTCANRLWMQRARTDKRIGSGHNDPQMHPCEACGTSIRKWVNSNPQRFCAACRKRSVGWRRAQAAQRAAEAA